MKVKILQCMAGSDFVRDVGDICEVDNDEGERIIAAGFAESVKPTRGRVPRQKEVEAATEI